MALKFSLHFLPFLGVGTLIFFYQNFWAQIFFYVFSTFDDVLSPKIAKNFFTPFKGRYLEILAQILGNIFLTFLDVLRCPESKK